MAAQAVSSPLRAAATRVASSMRCTRNLLLPRVGGSESVNPCRNMPVDGGSSVRPVDLSGAKERMQAAVEARSGALLEASHQIHEHPELNYEEHFAHDLLTGILADEGL